MNYNLNDLTDDTMVRFYQTFNLTLDTCEYVPECTSKMILRFLNKNLKKAFKQIVGEDRAYQRKLRMQFKKETKEKLKKEYARHGQKVETFPVPIGSAEAGDSGELCETECATETAGATDAERSTE